MQVSRRPFWHFPPVLVLAGGDLAEGEGGGGWKMGIIVLMLCRFWIAAIALRTTIFFFFFLCFFHSLFVSHSQWQSVLTYQSAELSQWAVMWVRGNVIWVVLACCVRIGGVGSVGQWPSYGRHLHRTPLCPSIRHGALCIKLCIFFIYCKVVFTNFVLIQFINSRY